MTPTPTPQDARRRRRATGMQQAAPHEDDDDHARQKPVKLQTNDTDVSSEVDESPSRDGRSENSLTVLCQRFCELYQDCADAINIDQAAKELGIQRRRMYEILNIIQSVGLVSRIRSSSYRWDGYTKMNATLHRLKEEGMKRQARERSSKLKSPEPPEPEGNTSLSRRKAVATTLGERFIQIFLCHEFPQPIILEDIMGVFASCVGGALTNQMSCARRLYDIANVFCSIGLVKKTSSIARDQRRKKRMYTWTGPTTGDQAPASKPQRTPPLKKSPRAKETHTTIKRESTSDSKSTGGSPRATRRRKKTKTAHASTAKPTSPKETKPSSSVVPIAPAPPPAPVAPRPMTTADTKPATAFPSRNIAVIQSTPSPAANSIASCTPTPPTPNELVVSSTSSTISTPTTTVAPASYSYHHHCHCTQTISSEMDSPLLLKAQVTHLTKALEEARQREKELLKRIEMQDSQINKLIDHRLSETSQHQHRRSQQPTFILNTNSPITNLVFSPYGAPTASSSSAMPSPFTLATSSASNTTTSSYRSAFVRKKTTRVGPQLVDPADNSDLSKPKASPLMLKASLNLSTSSSSSSSLLLSPFTTSSFTKSLEREKENVKTMMTPMQRVQGGSSSSPLNSSTSSTPSISTPPCHHQLIATAASSLLSLTPTQFTPFSPSYAMFSQSPSTDEESVFGQTQTSCSSTSSPPSSVNATGTAASSASSSSAGKRPPCFSPCVLLESPSSLASTFDGLSPLPNGCFS